MKAMTPEQAWKEIGERYAVPGRAAELLLQQDERGVDVVLELFCECLQARGFRLDARDRQEADDCVRDWRAQVVQPLRQVRRALKPMMERVSDAAQLRARIQASELQAERVQVGMLCEWLDKYLARSAAASAAGCKI